MRERFTKFVDEKKEIEHDTKERIERITAEFVAGFEVLKKYGLAATIYGSARCQLGDEMYQNAEKLAGELAKKGYAIITGGGPGVMEAANKGAKEAGGDSVGLNIQLPKEQAFNSYTTDSESFHYFFTRKVMLSFASEVYIYFPGGFGTLDELFEMLTLVQTNKIKKIPIILFGRAYWEKLTDWFESSLAEGYKTIDPGDVELYTIVDSVEEAVEMIEKAVKKSQKI